jgi:AcrR family transcriptional regulator
MTDSFTGPQPDRSQGTRERLITAAMRLFAERGYAGTTVGDIEAAAGLAPRSGALYQHFEGKRHVLEAALARHVRDLEEMQSAMDLLPLGDLRAELTLMARWNMQDLKRREDLYRFIRKEGDRFPELAEAVYEHISERPLRRVADFLRERFRSAGGEQPDCEALVAVLVQSMAAYRAHELSFGRPPLGVDEERFIETWVEVCLAYAGSRGIDVGSAGSEAAAIS